MRWFFALLILANIGFYFWRVAETPMGAERAVGVVAEGRPIVLLSEVELPDGLGSPVAGIAAQGEGEPGLAAEAPQSGGQEKVAAPAPVARECWVAGVYKSLDSARLAAQGGVDLVVKGEKTLKDVEYWVYLGGYDSFSAANAQHQQLRKNKIDSFVIRSGPLENAVSLGLFSDPARAEVQAKRMRQKGYDAKVRKLEQSAFDYWLVLEGMPDAPSWGAAYSQLMDKKNTEISVEKKSCNLVASWNEFD